jgi:clan AA aspartic protease (TIGR02281 family)
MKKSKVILIGCLLFSVSIANPNTGQQVISDIETQINYLERIVNDYFRGDLSQAANDAIHRLIDDNNERTNASNNEMKVRKDEFVAEFASLEQLKQHIYSNLIQQSRRSPSQQALAKSIERTKALRIELGEILAKKELAKSNGAIIVKAIFPGNEPCYMILDTGATRVSLPMEMAEVLGLSDKLGDEIETGLADGNKAKGRSVIIPSVTVAGKTVRNVAGIIMPSPSPGTDGLLGMSFHNIFLIEIDTERNPQVILKDKHK